MFRLRGEELGLSLSSLNYSLPAPLKAKIAAISFSRFVFQRAYTDIFPIQQCILVIP